MNGLASLLASYDLQIAEESSQEHNKTLETGQSDQQVSPAKTPNSSQKNIEIESYTLDLEETKKSYKRFFNQFRELRLDGSVYAYLSVMLREVLQSRVQSLSQRNFRKIIAACLFISVKYVVDEYVLFIEDFTKLSGMNKKSLEMLETNILVDVLNFDINFSQETIEEEAEILMEMAAC